MHTVVSFNNLIFGIKPLGVAQILFPSSHTATVLADIFPVPHQFLVFLEIGNDIALLFQFA
jgi:hypothetical protein